MQIYAKNYQVIYEVNHRLNEVLHLTRFRHVNLSNLETHRVIIMRLQNMLPLNRFPNNKSTNMPNQLMLCLMYKQLQI